MSTDHIDNLIKMLTPKVDLLAGLLKARPQPNDVHVDLTTWMEAVGNALDDIAAHAPSYALEEEETRFTESVDNN